MIPDGYWRWDHNKLKSIDKKDKKIKVGRVGCFVIRSGRGGGEKKLLPYPTSIDNTFELCIVWLLTVFSSSLTKNELYWDMEQIFRKINDLFHTTATNPLTVELTWKKKIWRWSKGEKNCGFCSGNAQLLLLEPTEMCMANVCLKEMGPNVFFLCVWDYGGCRSVRSRNMQKPNLRIVTVREVHNWNSKAHFHFLRVN